MGIGVSLWGECEEQSGMHLGGRGFVHLELIDPETGEPPLPVVVELLTDYTGGLELAARIQKRIRDVLVFTARVDLASWGTLQRSEYKSKLVQR